MPQQQEMVQGGSYSCVYVREGERERERVKDEGKYKATRPQSPWVVSLGGLCKQNEGNLQRKRGRKKASYSLN